MWPSLLKKMTFLWKAFLHRLLWETQPLVWKHSHVLNLQISSHIKVSVQMPKADSCESQPFPLHTLRQALAAKEKAWRKLRLSGIDEQPRLMAGGLKVQAFWQKGEGQLGQMNLYNLSLTRVLEGEAIHSRTPVPVLPSSSGWRGAPVLPILQLAQHLLPEATSTLKLGGAWIALPVVWRLAFVWLIESWGWNGMKIGLRSVNPGVL